MEDKNPGFAPQHPPNSPDYPPNYGDNKPNNQNNQSEKPQNSTADAATISIVGLVLAFLLPPIGLILSIIALKRSQGANEAKGIATAGVVIGGIFSLFFLGSVIAFAEIVTKGSSWLDELNTSLSTTTTTTKDTSTLAGVQAMVADKDYFSWEFPRLNCAMTDEEYAADRTKWLNNWLDCLNNSWGTTANQDLAKIGPPALVVVATSQDIVNSQCSRNNNTDASADVTGSFCRADDTIFMYSSIMDKRSPQENLFTLFHEYAHHLQLLQGVNIDSNIFIGFLYSDYPNQRISEDEALELSKTRSELNAECAALAMFKLSGQVDTAGGEAVVRNFAKPISDHPDSARYGSASVRQRISDSVMNSSRLTMQTCNTWKWSDSELRV
ncbi:hypothetical protein FWF93_00185 [Candidatus Saccharibacteria bacterium]|nr:hypothetical protein [Candidatus Saccharibacteria bacterium]